MEKEEKEMYCLSAAAIHLQEIIEQFVKDNPSVKYSDVMDFIEKVGGVFRDEI